MVVIYKYIYYDIIYIYIHHKESQHGLQLIDNIHTIQNVFTARQAEYAVHRNRHLHNCSYQVVRQFDPWLKLSLTPATKRVIKAATNKQTDSEGIIYSVCICQH